MNKKSLKVYQLLCLSIFLTFTSSILLVAAPNKGLPFDVRTPEIQMLFGAMNTVAQLQPKPMAKHALGKMGTASSIFITQLGKAPNYKKDIGKAINLFALTAKMASGRLPNLVLDGLSNIKQILSPCSRDPQVNMALDEVKNTLEIVNDPRVRPADKEEAILYCSLISRKMLRDSKTFLKGGRCVNETTKNVYCGSSRYRVTRCPVGGKIVAVKLVNRISSARCTFNKSWGYNPDYIWTNFGCRGSFGVTYVP